MGSKVAKWGFNLETELLLVPPIGHVKKYCRGLKRWSHRNNKNTYIPVWIHSAKRFVDVLLWNAARKPSSIYTTRLNIHNRNFCEEITNQ